jgi:integrase
MKGCRPVTSEEASDMLANVRPRDRLFILCSLTFGLRMSEALKLKFTDVTHGVIHIKSAKGSESITFPVPDNIKKATYETQKYYEAQGIVVHGGTPLFLNYTMAKTISRVGIHKMLKKVCTVLELEGKVNTHSFRKAMITRIYEMTGKDLIQTQKYSRHKNIGNLQYYIATTEETDLINNLNWT